MCLIRQCRAHCVIAFVGQKALLRDAGSKTGTRVNGKTITQHELRPDEVFSVGNSQIRFQPIVQLRKPSVVDESEDDETHEELRALSGSTLAHFDIGAVVGTGKSGVVFRARDTKDNREVARAKVYLPEFAENDEDLQRFIRAVKTMLPMRHPNVITLYGGGKTGPYCWMSMEFVEGESLKETIGRIGKGGKLDWKPAVRLSQDITRGLHYIHGEKIIHRNLSPGNILYSRTGTAKLGSLILAKALSGALAKDVTVGDNIPGEMRYLAPEQVGAGGPVDERADIYSLGTLMYALLTGRTPFDGDSLDKLATDIIQREPVSPRKFDPSIPEPLEKLVLRLLAKKPEDRLQIAGEVLSALGKCLAKLESTHSAV